MTQIQADDASGRYFLLLFVGGLGLLLKETLRKFACLKMLNAEHQLIKRLTLLATFISLQPP